MDQSEESPSMRGILSAGNWKILYSTPGRAIEKAQTESAKNSEIAVTWGPTDFMNAFIVFTCLQKTSVTAGPWFSKNSRFLLAPERRGYVLYSQFQDHEQYHEPKRVLEKRRP